MKSARATVTFFLVVLVFGSCEEAIEKSMHNKEIRVELGKYADVLDLERVKIDFIGGAYKFFSSAESRIDMVLYLKPGRSSHETITAVRDGVVAFFDNNFWETRGRYSFPDQVIIDFVVEDDEEMKIIYRAYTIIDPIYEGYEWFGRWRDDSPDGGFVDIINHIDFKYMRNPPRSSIGEPIMRRTISDEEFDILLDKYSDRIDTEQSIYSYSGTNFIIVDLYARTGSHTDIMEREIVDVLALFFTCSSKKLTEEYGSFASIRIFFFNAEEGTEYGRCLLKFNEPSNQWYISAWQF